MKLIIRHDRRNVAKACVNIAKALRSAGYISDRDMREIIYRANVGDRAVYREVRKLLLELTDEIKGVEYY